MRGAQLRRFAAAVVAGALSAGALHTSARARPQAAKTTPGVTATQVTIGATVPKTGIASVGENEAWRAANAVFRWVDAKGGIDGRTIRYVVKDDCDDFSGGGCTGVADTAVQTDKLLAVPVFATVGSYGTSAQNSVRALLKSRRVPQTFVSSGATEWNNPNSFSTLFGWQPSYVVEGKILARYIKHAWPGEKVCFLGEKSDLGKGGYHGLTMGGVKPPVTAYYLSDELTLEGSPYFSSFVHAEQRAGCKVVYLDTTPAATAAALTDAAAAHFTPHWAISSAGSDPATVATELGTTPDDEPGAVTFSFLPATTDAGPWNAWMTLVLEADPSDFPGFTSATPIDGYMAYGIGYAVAFVEALRAEGRHVTRPGFVSTLLSRSFETPALTPLRYSATNHQGLEGGYVVTVLNDRQTGSIDDGTVYSTTSEATPVTVTHRLSTTVPTWLQ